MPTNRNNNELGKAFAVGTKIEYNGKSYEVIESNSCVDCSAKCSNTAYGAKPSRTSNINN